MKHTQLTFLLAVIVNLSAYGQNQQKSSSNLLSDSALTEQRQMLKDFFFCSCLNYGFKQDSLFIKKDHSINVYLELLKYRYVDLEKIERIAQQVAKDIPTSNYTNKKGITSTCLDYYKGPQLNAIIMAMKIK